MTARSSTLRLRFPWSTSLKRASAKPKRMAAVYEQESRTSSSLPNVPQIFSQPPELQDPLRTATSEEQEETMYDVLPWILGTERVPLELNSHGLPKIRRDAHIQFLHKTLRRMSSAYTGYDASRPWVIYWTLTALSLLGQDISVYRDSVISTLAAAQNETGGFGGGDGQMSHIATSFAAVLSLAMVGGYAAFQCINRRAMWHWLGQIKQSAGGFAMAVGAELDVRGVYCSMVIITLLNLPLDLPDDAPARKDGSTSFLDKVPEWLSDCQSYEGGISAKPNGEAHAAYTYCGLACLSMLGKPKEMLTKKVVLLYLDFPSLLSWLSSRQNAPEGGFSGRTNKLVDSCYSHWAGGCWYFLQEVLRSPGTAQLAQNIWNKEGIIRYILSAAQNPTGGMRDKPGKHPDGYHSCYSLAGLMAMQTKQVFISKPETNQTHALEHAFGWSVHQEASKDSQLFDTDDLLVPLHPIFTIPYAAVEDFQSIAYPETRSVDTE